MGLYKKWKERNAFNAENCRRKQNKMENDRYEKKIEDIRARIDYVVSNCSDEHAVTCHATHKLCQNINQKAIMFFLFIVQFGALAYGLHLCHLAYLHGGNLQCLLVAILLLTGGNAVDTINYGQ